MSLFSLVYNIEEFTENINKEFIQIKKREEDLL